MASILKVDELRGIASAGDITITSEGGAATMQLQQGVAKMWHNIAGSGTVTTSDSFNVSSVGDIATGGYRSNLTNNMNNIVYAASGMGQNQTDIGHTSIATSYFQTAQRTSAGSDFDADNCMQIVHGDLA
jgi:hypothetical protein